MRLSVANAGRVRAEPAVRRGRTCRRLATRPPPRPLARVPRMLAARLAADPLQPVSAAARHGRHRRGRPPAGPSAPSRRWRSAPTSPASSTSCWASSAWERRRWPRRRWAVGDTLELRAVLGAGWPPGRGGARAGPCGAAARSLSFRRPRHGAGAGHAGRARDLSHDPDAGRPGRAERLRPARLAARPPRTARRPLVLMLGHERPQRRALASAWSSASTSRRRVSRPRPCCPSTPGLGLGLLLVRHRWQRNGREAPPWAERRGGSQPDSGTSSSVNRDLFLRNLLAPGGLPRHQAALGLAPRRGHARRQRRAHDPVHRLGLRARRLCAGRRGAGFGRAVGARSAGDLREAVRASFAAATLLAIP